VANTLCYENITYITFNPNSVARLWVLQTPSPLNAIATSTAAPDRILAYSMQGINQHQRAAPPVSRFVVLSFLLHVLLVLLFGDATGVRQGTSLFGSFVANLESRASVVPAPVSTSAPAPVINSTPNPNPTPNPTRVDRVTPTPSAKVENKTVEPQTQPAQTQTPAPTSSLEDAAAIVSTPAPVMVPDAPAALPPLIAKEVITPETSFVVPAFAPIPDVGAAKKVQPPSLQPPLQQQPIAPIPPPVTLEKLPAPKIENTFKPYTAPTAPAPVPTPAPLEKISPPKIDQEIAPFLPPQVLAREAPALPAPSTFAPTPTPLPTAAPAPAPTPVMIAPVDRLEKLAAPKVEREFAPTPSAPVVAAPTIATPTMATPSAPVVAPIAAVPNAGDLAKPRADAAIAPAGTAQKPSLAPTAVEGGGGTVAGPGAGAGAAAGNNANPPATLGPAPKLDLDSIRARAREIASEGSGQRAAFGFPPLPKETPKKSIEKIFDKTLQRPDCKDAYADMGLAAVVPLIRDTVKNEGCRW
jgi:hypothetical protein